MKITKYEHACLVLDEGGERLVIDPGVFATSFTDFSNIVGVVITHVHQDHFDADKLAAITQLNPNVKIYTVQTVADQWKGQPVATVVNAGSQETCGPFSLDFFGTEHALIHTSIPKTQNVGVMVNQLLYYPGDSFTVPHVPVDILAVPAGAPWMAVGEAMDFIVALKPKRVFPSHNAVLSEAGQGFHDGLLEAAAQGVNAAYLILKPGESLEA